MIMMLERESLLGLVAEQCQRGGNNEDEGKLVLLAALQSLAFLRRDDDPQFQMVKLLCKKKVRDLGADANSMRDGHEALRYIAFHELEMVARRDAGEGSEGEQDEGGGKV
jgi:hypothetical protein